ncbi:hypothetical protein ETU09_11230 [Apibacter muscae]|uniref:Acyltransferase 3 domain-containing protein n=1 Tax=Apibacter muscae TaxID=2509004 RepID=A0A563D867_9FLAO|nr:hypothetical protein ETU09_11230 [Apibacter muscae]
MNFSKERSYFFDNLKFLLILLVIFGRIIEYYIFVNHNYKSIYLFIYSFYMPLFIFISGYFSKNICLDKLKHTSKKLIYI